MLHRLVRVYTCQNATLLEISCRSSYSFFLSPPFSMKRGWEAYSITLIHLYGPIRKKREDSGRVIDLRPRGCGFKPHRRHIVVSLSKTHLSLLSTGSTQEDSFRHNLKIVDWDVKNQIIQNKQILCKFLKILFPQLKTE